MSKELDFDFDLPEISLDNGESNTDGNKSLEVENIPVKVNLIDNIEKTQETEKPSILDLDFPTLIDEKQAQGDIVAPLELKSPIEEPPLEPKSPIEGPPLELKSPIEEPPLEVKITY